jgi:aminoglycoside phosphotransferase (APT) family kinase protein
VHKRDITPDLIRKLLADQFPQWAELPIRPVDRDGWDNLTLRLGDHLSLRLPRGEDYAAQVEKEQRWLPILRNQLPIAIPNPVGKGEPGHGFPHAWSIYEWLPGHSATIDRVADRVRFAEDLGGFLNALYRINATGGPAAGWHSFYRGADLGHWDESARAAFTAVSDLIDAQAATKVWEAALTSTWSAPQVWFHGDMAPANLLVRDGCLSAVIDFGTSGVGDPACDLVIAWSFFEGESREAFRRTVAFDDDTWATARGWMLWKAAVTLREVRQETPGHIGTAGAQYGWRAGAQELIEDVLV